MSDIAERTVGGSGCVVVPGLRAGRGTLGRKRGVVHPRGTHLRCGRHHLRMNSVNFPKISVMVFLSEVK